MHILPFIVLYLYTKFGIRLSKGWKAGQDREWWSVEVRAPAINWQNDNGGGLFAAETTFVATDSYCQGNFCLAGRKLFFQQIYHNVAPWQ